MDLYDEKIKGKIISNIKVIDNCWVWQGTIINTGYGQISYHNKHYSVHRLSYILYIGEIPEKLELDHLCRNRKCCNPDHLEPVTRKENIRRSPLHNKNKTHCPQGHEYTHDNTYFTKSRNNRRCKICKKSSNNKGHKLRKELKNN